MFTRNRRALALSGVTAAVAAAAVGVGSFASASAATNWATVSSVSQGGGMSALVAAAKAEGKLNLITIPTNWANYGTIINQFKAKYPGIKINDAIPDGSSAQEIQAIEQDKGRTDAPDVVDIGQAFTAAEYQKLYAPYKVSSWSMIPSGNKAANGDYVNDYGGYVSFGCYKKLVKKCPTSWSQLTSPKFAKDITLNGIPGQAGAATGAVWAAALNQGAA